MLSPEAGHSLNLPPPDFQASTFGCFILINALHNYIWETRQRHFGKEWKTQETEQMHAHIEPALAAWQAIWANNPHHSLVRPNPFGYGPLAADSIPLLDLAYVRLFVNLGRSKEAFWQRDYDRMSEELARGTEIIQHADNGPEDSMPGVAAQYPANDARVRMDDGDSRPRDHAEDATSVQMSLDPYQSNKRERHLRKAALHAAHSLSVADRLGHTFADFTSRELPIASAMCAFDCGQVLAEWVATVQERVGRYLGILGKDEIDFESVPGIMLVEQEDVELLRKIEAILRSAEAKMAGTAGGDVNMNGAGAPPIGTGSISGPGADGWAALKEYGYSGKILMFTAYMLDKSAVWPVIRLMARSLEIQANHMKARAEKSTHRPELTDV